MEMMMSVDHRSAHRSLKLPSVSVIVPAYAQASWIAGALDSIQNQTYAGSIEVIVIDDGSPDDSAVQARMHASAPRVIRQKNTGVSGARNTGIAASKGTYIAFLDADDRWHPTKLERQITALEALGVPAISFTRYMRVGADGAQVLDAIHPELDLVPTARLLMRRNFIGTSTVVVHRQCIDDASGVFPDDEYLRKGGQDYALWLRIGARAPLVYVPEVLMKYTVHEDNRVGADPLKHFAGAMHALRDVSCFDPELIERTSGIPYKVIWWWRVLKLGRDVWVHRKSYPHGTILRAPRVVFEQWCLERCDIR